MFVSKLNLLACVGVCVDSIKIQFCYPTSLHTPHVLHLYKSRILFYCTDNLSVNTGLGLEYCFVVMVILVCVSVTVSYLCTTCQFTLCLINRYILS